MKSNRTNVSLYALLLFLIPLTVSAQMTWICATDSAGWSARRCHTSVVYDNKMWILGGATGGPPVPIPLNDVWYSPDGIAWTQATTNAQWSPRWGHTSVVFDNKLWVIGGSSGSGLMNDVWYTNDGVNWTQATANAEWLARVFHTSAVFDNKMWVFGGWSDVGNLNDVWYTNDGVNWTQATSNAQWSARRGHTSLVFDDKIWVIGGEIGNITYLNDVWYSLEGVNWMQATPNAGWLTRGYHTSIVFTGKMWVMGGMRYPYPYTLNDVWYSPDGIIWTQATGNAQWLARYGHSSVVFDEKMWVIGGGNYDVWYSSGLGIEEQNILPSNTYCYNPTIFRGPLQLPEGTECRVFDITGRVVEPDKIQPGIYFLEIDGEIVQKVVKIR